MVRILSYYETWRVYSKLLLLLYYYFLTLKVLSAFVVSDGLTVIHFYASADFLLHPLPTPPPSLILNLMNFLIILFQRSCNCCKSSLQVLEFQQRKCSVIFDLSCNLTRVLEFCTHEIPQAFLLGTDTNLRRLTELIVFILNHVTSAVDAEIFDL